MQLLLGSLKGILFGGVIGGGLGYGFMQLGLTHGVLSYIFFGLIGALVGFAAGKPFWKHSPWYVVPVIKAVVGFGVCLGLFALAHNYIGGLSLGFIQKGATLSNTTYVLGAIIGIVFGALVGLDESVDDKPDNEQKEKKDSDGE